MAITNKSAINGEAFMRKIYGKQNEDNDLYRYTKDDILGEGTYGKVYKCTRLRDGAVSFHLLFLPSFIPFFLSFFRFCFFRFCFFPFCFFLFSPCFCRATADVDSRRSWPVRFKRPEIPTTHGLRSESSELGSVRPREANSSSRFTTPRTMRTLGRSGSIPNSARAETRTRCWTVSPHPGSSGASTA